MTDEIASEATVETSTAPAAEESAAAAPPAEPIDWDALNATLARAYEADPKTASEHLKKHRAIGGIAGSIAERRIAELNQQNEVENQAKATKKAREELEDMARNRPIEFADTFLSRAEADKARERIGAVETNAQKEILEQVGAAYHELEEWGQITDEERGRLASALQGVPSNRLIAAFNKTALDIVADRRAENRLQSRLPKEKEAWRKEWEAERLAGEDSPDLRRPSSTTRRPLNWGSMNEKDFNEYWKQRYGS